MVSSEAAREQVTGYWVAAKRFQITVLLDREEHVRFSAYCDERGYKKSTLVARLIRDHLNSEGYRTQRPLPLNTRMSEWK